MLHSPIHEPFTPSISIHAPSNLTLAGTTTTPTSPTTLGLTTDPQRAPSSTYRKFSVSPPVRKHDPHGKRRASELVAPSARPLELSVVPQAIPSTDATAHLLKCKLCPGETFTSVDDQTDHRRRCHRLEYWIRLKNQHGPTSRLRVSRPSLTSDLGPKCWAPDCLFRGPIAHRNKPLELHAASCELVETALSTILPLVDRDYPPYEKCEIRPGQRPIIVAGPSQIRKPASPSTRTSTSTPSPPSGPSPDHPCQQSPPHIPSVQPAKDLAASKTLRASQTSPRYLFRPAKPSPLSNPVTFSSSSSSIDRDSLQHQNSSFGRKSTTGTIPSHDVVASTSISYSRKRSHSSSSQGSAHSLLSSLYRSSTLEHNTKAKSAFSPQRSPKRRAVDAIDAKNGPVDTGPRGSDSQSNSMDAINADLNNLTPVMPQMKAGRPELRQPISLKSSVLGTPIDPVNFPHVEVPPLSAQPPVIVSSRDPSHTPLTSDPGVNSLTTDPGLTIETLDSIRWDCRLLLPLDPTPRAGVLKVVVVGDEHWLTCAYTNIDGTGDLNGFSWSDVDLEDTVFDANAMTVSVDSIERCTLQFTSLVAWNTFNTAYSQYFSSIVRLDPNAVQPTKAHENRIGSDATDATLEEEEEELELETGLAIDDTDDEGFVDALDNIVSDQDDALPWFAPPQTSDFSSSESTSPSKIDNQSMAADPESTVQDIGSVERLVSEHTESTGHGRGEENEVDDLSIKRPMPPPIASQRSESLPVPIVKPEIIVAGRPEVSPCRADPSHPSLDSFPNQPRVTCTSHPVYSSPRRSLSLVFNQLLVPPFPLRGLGSFLIAVELLLVSSSSSVIPPRIMHRTLHSPSLIDVVSGNIRLKSPITILFPSQIFHPLPIHPTLDDEEPGLPPCAHLLLRIKLASFKDAQGQSIVLVDDVWRPRDWTDATPSRSFTSGNDLVLVRRESDGDAIYSPEIQEGHGKMEETARQSDNWKPLISLRWHAEKSSSSSISQSSFEEVLITRDAAPVILSRSPLSDPSSTRIYSTPTRSIISGSHTFVYSPPTSSPSTQRTSDSYIPETQSPSRLDIARSPSVVSDDIEMRPPLMLDVDGEPGVVQEGDECARGKSATAREVPCLRSSVDSPVEEKEKGLERAFDEARVVLEPPTQIHSSTVDQRPSDDSGPRPSSTLVQPRKPSIRTYSRSNRATINASIRSINNLPSTSLISASRPLLNITHSTTSTSSAVSSTSCQLGSSSSSRAQSLSGDVDNRSVEPSASATPTQGHFTASPPRIDLSTDVCSQRIDRGSLADVLSMLDAEEIALGERPSLAQGGGIGIAGGLRAGRKEREEEIFELECVHDGQKLLMCLWNRWVERRGPIHRFNCHTHSLGFVERYASWFRTLNLDRHLVIHLKVLNAYDHLTLESLVSAHRRYLELKAAHKAAGGLEGSIS